MTPKQQKFLDAYLVDPNATKAAQKAGYSKKTAYSQGQRLLKHVEIASALSVKQEKRAEKLGLTQEYVVETLREVVERTMQHVPVMRFDRIKKTMVQETNADGEGVWQFDARGAVGALALLGKHMGMFVERSEVTQTNVTYVVEHPPKFADSEWQQRYKQIQ